ncbi:MAG TPA: hypothetical protein GX735_06490 [Firmicutes bacterium]|jgi:hypothetical protein|nr:hypothetical protein [Bacillota bacterium]
MRGATGFFLILLLLSFLFSYWGKGPGPVASPLVLPGVLDNRGEVTAAAAALPGLVAEEPVLYFSHGCACVVGEVMNERKRATAWVRVEAIFRNRRGEIVGQEYTYINHLNPGEKKPYRLLLPEEEAVESIEIFIAPGYPAQEKAIPLMGSDLQISRGKGGFLHITGKVTNIGTEELDLVKVILKFTGAEGEIIAMAFHYLPDLQPGEERKFACSSEEREGWTGVEMLFD